MKRLFHITILAFTLWLTLLFSSCAPRGNMIATLTQLPYAATPHTSTPGPTFTPRATRTITPAPPGYQATSIVLTGTYSARMAAPTLTTIPTATAFIPAPCIPGVYDEAVPAPDAPEEYIGKHYNQDALPGEIQWLSSGDLEEDWRWARIRVQGQEMYWILKVGCRDERNLPYWEIADALTIPLFDPQTNEVVADLCFYGSNPLDNVIAYGAYDPSTPAATVTGSIVGWPVRIITAWQMKERFVPVSTRELVCVVKK
jgi:hypothetical protein